MPFGALNLRHISQVLGSSSFQLQVLSLSLSTVHFDFLFLNAYSYKILRLPRYVVQIPLRPPNGILDDFVRVLVSADLPEMRG